MRTYKIYIVFLFMQVFTISCEKENILQLEQTRVTTKITAELLALEEIPELTEALNGAVEKSTISWGISKSGKTKYWLDMENIVKVTDSIGNQTYAVQIKSLDLPSTAIYNLVAIKRKDGKEISPFVMEYLFEKGDKYTYAVQRDKKFEGKINVYSLREFVNAVDFQDKLPKIIPCYNDIGETDYSWADNPNTGNDGGAPSGGNSSTTGSYSGTSYNSGGAIAWSNTGKGTKGTVEVGVGTFTSEVCEKCQAQKSGNFVFKGDHCPEGEIVVPINSEEELVWDEDTIMEELSPETPIEDMDEFLECYDTSMPAVITIYANQPVEGSSSPISFFGDVGHSFISISQGGKTSTFGFYPQGDGLRAITGSSVIGNNGGDSYNISISKTISGDTLYDVLDSAINYTSVYDLNLYNCTDYVRFIGNEAGMNIPSAWGAYPGRGIGGQNPGKLGEVLRGMDGQKGITVNLEGGKAPSKASGCN